MQTRKEIAILLVASLIGILALLVFGCSFISSSELPPAKQKPIINRKKSVTPNAGKVSLKGGGLPPGCVCHSKSQRLVSMHQLFSVEDCNKCHQQGESLMNRAGKEMTPERIAALRERMKKEDICKECHRGDKVIVNQKKEISGRLFCPQDKKIYRKSEVINKDGKYYCPQQGIELIDIDEIAIKSAKEPKNEHCIPCHSIGNELNKKHEKVINTLSLVSIEDCLKCHTSHSQCRGCHF